VLGHAGQGGHPGAAQVRCCGVGLGVNDGGLHLGLATRFTCRG
jgi:hypothetical protein